VSKSSLSGWARAGDSVSSANRSPAPLTTTNVLVRRRI
jgi:hypothetical protein